MPIRQGAVGNGLCRGTASVIPRFTVGHEFFLARIDDFGVEIRHQQLEPDVVVFWRMIDELTDFNAVMLVNSKHVFGLIDPVSPDAPAVAAAGGHLSILGRLVDEADFVRGGVVLTDVIGDRGIGFQFLRHVAGDVCSAGIGEGVGGSASHVSGAFRAGEFLAPEAVQFVRHLRGLVGGGLLGVLILEGVIEDDTVIMRPEGLSTVLCTHEITDFFVQVLSKAFHEALKVIVTEPVVGRQVFVAVCESQNGVIRDLSFDFCFRVPE